MTNPTAKNGRGSFAVLSNRSFRSFTISVMLWMMADNIEHVVSYWVIFEKFDTPLLGGYAVISHWAPALFAGVYMGALADRYDCRKLFLIAMGMFMFASLAWAFLFWTDTVAVWHAVFILTIHGLASAIFSPASQVMIHDIVGSSQLPSAVRLSATSRQAGILLGPAIGGLMLLLLGPALALFLNAAIYIPMVMWSLREKYTGHGDVDTSTLRSSPMNWSIGAIGTTIREVATNRTIIAMIALVGLSSLLVGNAYQAQMPEFAESFLTDNTGAIYTALLLASAVGAIIGGLAQETIRSFSPSPRKAIVLASLWSSCFIAFVLAPHYSVALVILLLAGMLQISFTSMSQALVQLEAPSSKRGRIIGLYNMSFNGLRTGSGVSVGVLGAAIGIHWSLGLSAAVLVLVMMVLLLFVKSQPAPVLAGDGARRSEDQAAEPAAADRTR